jgi:hypothetical protein
VQKQVQKQRRTEREGTRTSLLLDLWEMAVFPENSMNLPSSMYIAR